MSHPPSDYVDFRGDEARFFGVVAPRVARHFLDFARNARRQRRRSVLLDFSRVTNAYPNSMLPIIASVQSLIAQNVKTECILPRSQTLSKLFLRTNWAHFLAPRSFSSSDTNYERHLACRQFNTEKEQQDVVADFIDVALRTLQLGRDTLDGLEWAITEITDNVLNHSLSTVGGFVQLVTFPGKNWIAFCVADAGQGILNSLREGIPTLRTDKDAISEAVRTGVTRNKDVGQGNGLSGTLKIATSANGRMSVTSGVHTVIWNDKGVDHVQAKAAQRYEGTVVDVQFSTDTRLDLAQILSLGSGSVWPGTDRIELKYLSDDCKTLTVRVRDEEAGFGSRRAGVQMRTMCNNLMRAEPGCVLMIDWDGIQMISSSYADEFIGKLFVELGPVSFMSRIRQTNMLPVVQSLVDRAIMQRTQQQMQAMAAQMGDHS